MSTYFFETITAAQALAFNGQVDALVFTNASQTGASERLIFNADGTIRVLSNVDGVQATFGSGLAGAAQIIYPDGSRMLVGSTGADLLTGGALGDGLFGGFGADTLIGGAGDDALQGGPGADVLTGGAGHNLFLIAGDESPANVGQMDTITDWNSGDELTFFRGATPASSYVEGTAADFSSAKAFATSQIGSGAVEYAAVQVGADVIVFADSFNHNVVEDAVVLAGRTLNDIDSGNIGTTAIFPAHSPSPPPPVSPPPISPPPISPPPVSPPPVSPPPVTPGQGVSATISGAGNLDLSQAQHLIDDGVASFSPTSLTLTDGASSMSLGGFGFTLDSAGDLVAGTLTNIHFHLAGGAGVDVTGMSLPVVNLVSQFEFATTGQILSGIFGGNDVITGDGGPNTIHGYDGNDTIGGVGGAAFLSGDNGDDSLTGGAGADVLVGGFGADTMAGGAGANVFQFTAGDSSAAAVQNGLVGRLDHIIDWTNSDFLQFTDGPAMTASGYTEITASTFDQALNIAVNDRPLFGSQIPYVAAQVGGDVIVFGGGQVIQAVVLVGRTLDDISAANLGNDPTAHVPSPPPPVGPHSGATVNLYDGADMGAFQESQLSDATATRSPGSDVIVFGGGAARMTITGSGLTYGADGVMSGGTVTGLDITSPNGHFQLTGAHVNGSVLGDAYHSNNADI
ncbi:MAG: hypothetical protein JSR98_12495, partial [Proteobacteria bacterium]|nr:hypothetical protein [Pseudomonadota bacterium]